LMNGKSRIFGENIPIVNLFGGNPPNMQRKTMISRWEIDSLSNEVPVGNSQTPTVPITLGGEILY